MPPTIISINPARGLTLKVECVVKVVESLEARGVGLAPGLPPADDGEELARGHVYDLGLLLRRVEPLQLLPEV